MPRAVANPGRLEGAPPTVRLEHGAFLPRESLAQLPRLGASPSFHIHHIRFYGDALAEAIVGLQAAMNRKTGTGRQLNPAQRISVPYISRVGLPI